ncbi:hypothetical protein [Acidithiobacillus concretivorus]|uniref:Uncharacterized protein n=1 Tax=Acidithiobacillus concretivorus TaxID=3063952 RepID=A0ABS5ZT24_9PROT|nr:hypothetical protein [Acidithiobacillus concretivorus]MBU2739109.1 hypothetical protein [Acidithiobacillus concretivorus]
MHTQALYISIAAYYLFVIFLASVLTKNINAYRWGGAMPRWLMPLVWLSMFLFGPCLLIVALPLRLFGIRMLPVFIPRNMLTQN